MLNFYVLLSLESNICKSASPLGFPLILKVNGMWTVNPLQTPLIYQWGDTTSAIVPLGTKPHWNRPALSISH